MEIIIQLLVEIVGEFLIQIFGELFAEFGLRSLAEPFVKRSNRSTWLAVLGYCLLGLIIGGLSLLIFPNSFVRSERFHGINLIVTPLLAGLVMAGIGRLRARHGKDLIRLDSFAYGFVFALGMALVRFLFTN